MGQVFDPGALLGTSYPVRGGYRVRLRIARTSDASSIRGLLERLNLGPADLEVARLVQFDPRRRCVLCATALIDGSETLVGVGAVDLDGPVSGVPDTLIVDAPLADELPGLLTAALAGRARLTAARAA